MNVEQSRNFDNLFLIRCLIDMIDVLFYRGRRLPFLASYFAGTG